MHTYTLALCFSLSLSVSRARALSLAQESSDILRAKLVTVSDQLSQQMEMKENNDQVLAH